MRVPPEQLANWTGNTHPLVEIDGERWMLKQDGRREILGHLLADGWLNVPEARPWEDDDHGHRAAIRLAENYRVRDLPIRDLDEAVASELVFSVWIRRRDAHAFNRAYLRGGIPMFFDHGAAFGTETDSAHFMRPGPDFGYVPTWRASTRFSRPTTMALRSATVKAGHAMHAVRSRATVRRHIDTWITWVLERPDTEIARAVGRAGLGPDTTQLLVRSRAELPRLMEPITEMALDGAPDLETMSA